MNVLNMPIEDIPSRFVFKVRTTEVDETEEARRANNLARVQLFSMYTKELAQDLQMAMQAPPELQPAFLKLMVGLTRLVHETFEDFGTENPDRYLPYIKQYEMMVEQMESQMDRQLGAVNVRRDNAQVGPNGGGGASPGGLPLNSGIQGAAQAGPPQSQPSEG